MDKWFFPPCLLAFAAALTDKMLRFLIFTGLVMKSHTFFLLATVNVPPPTHTGENKKDWGGVGGWNQLEGKSNLPKLAETHVSQARVIV